MTKQESEMQILNAIGERIQRDFGKSVAVELCRQGRFEWVRITPSRRKGMTVDLLMEGPGVVRVVGRGALDQEFIGKSEPELRASVIEFVEKIGKFGAYIRRIGPWTIGQAELPQTAGIGPRLHKSILLYRIWLPWK